MQIKPNHTTPSFSNLCRRYVHTADSWEPFSPLLETPQDKLSTLQNHRSLLAPCECVYACLLAFVYPAKLGVTGQGVSGLALGYRWRTERPPSRRIQANPAATWKTWLERLWRGRLTTVLNDPKRLDRSNPFDVSSHSWLFDRGGPAQVPFGDFASSPPYRDSPYSYSASSSRHLKHSSHPKDGNLPSCHLAFS